MSANVPLNLGLLHMLDRLGGQKSAKLPELLDGIQPVVIYSDLSSSITSELFEGRAVASFGSLPPDIGFWGACELQAGSGGGLLIERITVRNTFDSNGFVIAVNTFSSITSGLTTALVRCDIGGVASVSVPVFNPHVVALPPNAVTLIAVQNEQTDLAPERIYVPPSSFFLIAAATTGVRLDGTLIWRELTDTQGAQ